MFLHLGFWHLLGNLLWLYFVGSILEDLVGSKPIYWLFLGGGIVGALVFQVVYSFSVYSDLQTPMQLLGASGGVSAVVIGTAVFTPRYRLFLFGLIEVELRWIALVKVLLDLSGLASGSNIGGYTAHLGGILWGAGYVYFSLIFTKKSARNTALRFEKGDKVLDSKKADKHRGPTEAEVNAILDKISQVGYNNLSAKEKETLFKASKTD
jgi:membrane associated rhomboid family serine protease